MSKYVDETDTHFIKPDGTKVHKKSLSNLIKSTDKDQPFNFENKKFASEAGRKGGEAKAKKFMEKKRAKEISAELRDLKRSLDLQNEKPMEAKEILELLMLKAMAEDDYDTAGHYANQLAPYQSAKKAQVQQSVSIGDYEGLSNEEIAARLAFFQGRTDT